jgi:hypothetical protein
MMNTLTYRSRSCSMSLVVRAILTGINADIDKILKLGPGQVKNVLIPGAEVHVIIVSTITETSLTLPFLSDV